MSKEFSSLNGTSTQSLLGIVFITLKLCGVIDWSWVWVLFPFWGDLIIGSILVMTGIAAFCKEEEEDKKRKQKIQPSPQKET